MMKMSVLQRLYIMYKQEFYNMVQGGSDAHVAWLVKLEMRSMMK